MSKTTKETIALKPFYGLPTLWAHPLITYYKANPNKSSKKERLLSFRPHCHKRRKNSVLAIPKRLIYSAHIIRSLLAAALARKRNFLLKTGKSFMRQ